MTPELFRPDESADITTENQTAVNRQDILWRGKQDTIMKLEGVTGISSKPHPTEQVLVSLNNKVSAEIRAESEVSARQILAAIGYTSEQMQFTSGDSPAIMEYAKIHPAETTELPTLDKQAA
jgi:hypothetical protein